MPGEMMNDEARARENREFNKQQRAEWAALPPSERATLDAWLDTFADWSVEDQEASLELCAHIHRQAKRRKPEPAESVDALAQGVVLDAAGGKA